MVQCYAHLSPDHIQSRRRASGARQFLGRNRH